MGTLPEAFRYRLSGGAPSPRVRKEIIGVRHAALLSRRVS